MSSPTVAALSVFIASLAVTSISDAALIDRGGGLIYDTDLNITWLADANYGAGSIYDDVGWNGGTTTDGLMTWQNAMNWAADLIYYDSVRGISYSDWRLPTTNDPCSNANCDNSEMGHLFYLELGGIATFDISSTHNTNFALFQNIPDAADYWSGTDMYSNNRHLVWGFDMDNGIQSLQGDPGAMGEYVGLYAWAVRDGDVAVVPLPTAFWLLNAGLAVLIGHARRKSTVRQLRA